MDSAPTISLNRLFVIAIVSTFLAIVAIEPLYIIIGSLVILSVNRKIAYWLARVHQSAPMNVHGTKRLVQPRMGIISSTSRW